MTGADPTQNDKPAVPAADAVTDVEAARETPRTSIESSGNVSNPSLSRASRQPSLMRPSVNAWMRTSGNAGGSMHRMSAAGFRAQIANEAMSRMSYNPTVGWRPDDTAELIDVCLLHVCLHVISC